MIYLRSTLFNLFFILVTLGVSLAVLLSARWISFERLGRLARLWADLSLWGLRVLCNLSYRLECDGQVPDRACIIVSNHQSTWETVAFRTLLPTQQVYVLKQELLRLPVFGWALRFFAPIAIDRSRGKAALVEIQQQGRAALQAGRHVIIFPEGTRVSPGTLGKMNIGAAKLAESSGYPLLPIAHNSGEFWRRHSFLRHPGVVRVHIGALIEPAGRSTKTIHQELEAWMRSRIAPETLDRPQDAD